MLNKLKVLFIVYLLSTGLFALGSVDINRISIGARPIGMGGSFIALANDASAMFLNPAGLGQLTNPYFHNTQTNLLGEVNYFILGGVMPLEKGVLATSFQQAAVEAIPLTTLDDNDQVIKNSEASYRDALFLIAYGKFLGQKTATLQEGLYAGFALKYFSKGVADIALGKGFDLDLGFLYKDKNKWQVGAVQKNLLTLVFDAEMINWTTGAKDKLDSYTKVGFIYLLNHKWRVLTDYDFSLRRGKSLFHLGTEYTIKDILQIRAGWEQLDDCIRATNFSHFSVGFSLAIGGVIFDYAYVPYYQMENNEAHYISIQYKFTEEVSFERYQKQGIYAETKQY